MVLDGLDEAADPAGLVLQLLARINPSGAPSLRLLVGIRTSARQEGELLPELPVVAALNPRVVSADDDEYWDEAALVRHCLDILMDARAPAGDQRVRAEAIAARSARSFLLGGLAASSARDEPEASLDDVFARGIRQMMLDDLATTLPSGELRRADTLLRVAALAFGRGIPLRGLWSRSASALASGEEPFSEDDVERLLAGRAAGYLLQDLEDGVTVFRPFHERLREALADGGPDQPTREEAQRRIAVALARDTHWEVR